MGKLLEAIVTMPASMNAGEFAPIDDRYIVESYADLSGETTFGDGAYVYPGLQVYVNDTKEIYVYIGTLSSEGSESKGKVKEVDANGNLVNWRKLSDATSSADKINENLNDIATAVGLSGSTTATTLGFDTTNTSGDTYISGATNVIDALDKLNDELEHRPRFSAVCENCLEIKDETLGVKIADVSDLTDTTANTILDGETADNIHKNIIKESANGVYAFADLHYDTLNNKLTFINSNGSKDIKLSGINFLSGITYNNDTEELELWYQPMGESTFTATTVPMSDLIEEYSFLPKAFSATETSASTTNHNVTITSVRSTTGETKVYGDIDVFDCGTY